MSRNKSEDDFLEFDTSTQREYNNKSNTVSQTDLQLFNKKKLQAKEEQSHLTKYKLSDNHQKDNVLNQSQELSKRAQSVFLQEDMNMKKSKNYLYNSVFNENDLSFKLEPDTEENIEIMALLNIGGHGKPDDDNIFDENINETLGGLVDKQRMNDLIKELEQQNQQFFIEVGSNRMQKFDFKFNDEIFTISEAQSAHQSSQLKPSCYCCGDVFKNYKDAKYCQFCGLSYCAKCRQKTRMYPQVNSSNQFSTTRNSLVKDEDRGDICKVCDRKFYIREFLQDKNLQIEAQTNQLLGKNGLNSQIEKSSEQLTQIRQNFKKDKKMYSHDYQKIQLIKDKHRQKMNKIKKEQKEMELKNNDLMNRQEQIREDILKFDLEINEQKDEIQKINEELSNLDNHGILIQQELRSLQIKWQEHLVAQQSLNKVQPNQKQNKNSKTSKKEPKNKKGKKNQIDEDTNISSADLYQQNKAQTEQQSRFENSSEDLQDQLYFQKQLQTEVQDKYNNSYKPQGFLDSNDVFCDSDIYQASDKASMTSIKQFDNKLRNTGFEFSNQHDFGNSGLNSQRSQSYTATDNVYESQNLSKNTRNERQSGVDVDFQSSEMRFPDQSDSASQKSQRQKQLQDKYAFKAKRKLTKGNQDFEETQCCTNKKCIIF